MEKTIEIPEGYEARIEGNKVILESKLSEDERMIKAIHIYLDWLKGRKDYEPKGEYSLEDMISWVEKQGISKMSAEALREGVAHYGITQYQIDNWLKKYVEVETTVCPKYEIGDVIRVKNSNHEFIINRITDGYYHSKGAFIEIRIADDVNGDWEYVRHIQPEPKFNVGDTIIAKPENCMEHIPFHITSIEGGFYWDGDDSILIDNQDEFVLVGKTVKEPAHKFNVGDWVILTAGELSTTLQIVNVDTNKKLYWFNDNSYLPIVDDDCLHLWTIQDAKGGDVLADQDSVFIFKHMDKTGLSLCKSHCEVIGNSGLGLGFEFSINGVYPATKEQRDLLFQKMKEAGYEWDIEKKELSKIEQKPADNIIEKEKPLLEKFKQAVYDCAWGKVTCKAEGETKEEYANRWAEHFLLMVRDWADDYIDYAIQQKLRKSYDKGKEDAIKTNSPAWSEEDEHRITDTIYFLETAKKHYASTEELDACIEWLKFIKERVCPEQEWSEEDEKMLASFFHKLEVCTLLTNNEYRWADKKLKSLIPQNTWKPSDEQLEALEHSLGDYNIAIFEDRHEILTSLYQDIKKLKEKRPRKFMSK